MMNRPDSQRLFFALWPDAGTVESIQANTAQPLQSCRGRIIKQENLHFTLAFVGPVDSATHECVQQAASEVKGESFELTLSRLGHFPRPRVVWLAPPTIPAALQRLQADLSLALQQCGYQPEARIYQPHMTLMRKANRGPQRTEIEPIHMKVKDFVLVSSETTPAGAIYKIIQHWPLAE